MFFSSLFSSLPPPSSRIERLPDIRDGDDDVGRVARDEDALLRPTIGNRETDRPVVPSRRSTGNVVVASGSAAAFFVVASVSLVGVLLRSEEEALAFGLAVLELETNDRVTRRRIPADVFSPFLCCIIFCISSSCLFLL
jgi:hypothetical protein